LKVATSSVGRINRPAARFVQTVLRFGTTVLVAFALSVCLPVNQALAAKEEATKQVKKSSVKRAAKSGKGQRKGKRVSKEPIIPAKPSVGHASGLHEVPDAIGLRSSVALVIDTKTGAALFEKNPSAVLPIASLTKLMMGLVVLDGKQDLNEKIEVERVDIDLEKNSRSRLPIGSVLTRKELMQLALMASENRAASALARNYPGGLKSFVAAMNEKAKLLRMDGSQFADPSGLSPENMSSAKDLLKLVGAVDQVPLLRQMSVAQELQVNNGKRPMTFGNSNRMIKSSAWDLRLQKTGFINEAGSCLILHGKVDNRPVTIILLDAEGRLSKFGDAHRIREWLANKT
jgi:serine-type D-Ala-D-Ala endopeptidase (penicillin-binding protein 7)